MSLRTHQRGPDDTLDDHTRLHAERLHEITRLRIALDYMHEDCTRLHAQGLHEITCTSIAQDYTHKDCMRLVTRVLHQIICTKFARDVQGLFESKQEYCSHGESIKSSYGLN